MREYAIYGCTRIYLFVERQNHVTWYDYYYRTCYVAWPHYLCQWAPAACLGFLHVTFGTVGALTSIEFSESGRPPLNTDGHSNQKPAKLPPRCRHAHSFRILLGILLLDPPFSSTILLHKFAQVFDTLKIPVNCFGTRNTLKRWFIGAFCKHFSFVMPFSHESKHTKLMTSLIINLSLAVFDRQSLPWEGLNKRRGDPDSSSSGHFFSVPSSAGFIRLIYLRSLLLYFFCATLASNLLLTVCFECSLFRPHGPSI